MFSLVSLATTAAVSLSCVLDDHGMKVPMTVRLDEARGAVHYSLPATGQPVTTRALFLRERVTFDRFMLDRASLGIIHEGGSVTAVRYAQAHDVRGQCRITYTVTPAKAGVSRGRRDP